MPSWELIHCGPQQRDWLAEQIRLGISDPSWTSDESLYRRFHGPKRTMTRAELRYLSEVDGIGHAVWIASLPGEPRPLGIARLVQARQEPTSAEIALIVADPWHGHGIASALLDAVDEHAARVGPELGLTRLIANVQLDNGAMTRILRRRGWQAGMGQWQLPIGCLVASCTR